MTVNRIKAAQAPAVREALLKRQGYRCPLCNGSLTAGSIKKPALDHCHDTGFLRDVTCINCNGIEGKVHNLARRAKHTLTVQAWLTNLLAYYDRHSTPQHGGVLHHTHRTAEEKRIAQNTKARKTRAAVKAKLTP